MQMPESSTVASSSPSEQSRVDTESLRLQNPIVDVVARYGVELRRTGSSFTGRCPFHADGGRPNLVVFPRSARWACFRCDARGDAIASCSGWKASHFARLQHDSATR